MADIERLLESELQRLRVVRNRYRVHGQQLGSEDIVAELPVTGFNGLRVNRLTGAVFAHDEVIPEILVRVRNQVAVDRQRILLEEKYTIQRIQALVAALTPELGLIDTWEIP